MTEIVKVEVDGLERLRVTMARAADTIADMQAPLGQASRRAATRASQLAPKVTGRLAGSVRATPATATQAGITATVPYAGVQEYGWPARHVTANPYLRPALAQTAPDTLKDMTAHAQHSLTEVKGA